MRDENGAPKDVKPRLDQPRVPCGAVQVHDGLYQLRPEGEALPVGRHATLGHVVELRGEAVLLPDLVVVVQRLEGGLVVPDHAEQPGPEGLQVLEERHRHLAALHGDPEVPVVLGWNNVCSSVQGSVVCSVQCVVCSGYYEMVLN